LFLGEVKARRKDIISSSLDYQKQKLRTDKQFIFKPQFTRHAGKAGGFGIISPHYKRSHEIRILIFVKHFTAFYATHVGLTGFAENSNFSMVSCREAGFQGGMRNLLESSLELVTPHL